MDEEASIRFVSESLSSIYHQNLISSPKWTFLKLYLVFLNLHSHRVLASNILKYSKVLVASVHCKP